MIAKYLLTLFLVSFSFYTYSESLEDIALPFQTPPLETVVVTAKPEPTTLNLAPLAISVLSSESLDAVNAQHPNELAILLPNTWVSRGNGQEHLTAIRSPVFTGVGACGNFLMAEDGIPLRSSGFCNTNQLFDSFYEVSERVESFRGPNSAVFGSNALFGGFNFSTPSITQDSDRKPTQIRLGANTTQQAYINWTAHLPQLLTFGSIIQDTGYRKSSGVDQQKVGFKWQSHYAAWQQTSALFLNNLNQETAGFIEGENAFKSERLARANPNPEAFRNARSLRGYSKWQRKLNEQSGISVTPYVRANTMQFLMHFLPWQPTEKNGHKGLGVKSAWHYKQGKWRWELGNDIEWTKGYLKETQQSPSPFAQDRIPVGVHYDYRITAYTTGLFAYSHYAVTPRLNISSHLRWDIARFNYRNTLQSGSACQTGVLGCRFYRPVSQNSRFQHPSARLAFTYSTNRALNWYGNIASAFRTPQTTELYRLQSPEQSNQADNVRVDGIEIGLRGKMRSLSYSLAAFAMKQFDGIYQDSNRNYISGAKTDHRGIEYETTYSYKAFNIRAAGTISEHTYSNTPLGFSESVNIKGNRIDTAPKQLHHITLNWYANDKTHLQFRASHYGLYFLTAENRQRYPGHTLFDVSWRNTFSKRWSVNFSIKNMMNKRYAERADFAFGEYRYFPSLPRRAGITFKWQNT